MTDKNSDSKQELRDALAKVKASESEVRALKEKAKSYAIWGATATFFVFVVAGQWFPGYQLDSTAKAATEVEVHDAVGGVMAHLCAERYMAAAELETRLGELDSKKNEWDQVNAIREGGWGNTPDGDSTQYGVAEKCLQLVLDRSEALAKA